MNFILTTIKRLRPLLMALIFMCIVNKVFAQAPAITSFAPASGPAGTIVTINGSNFNTITTGNTVYFGAAIATVVSASATQLQVTAPKGTTCQPITVTTNGLTAYSANAFSLTFGAPQFSATYFTSRVDVSTTTEGIAVKDLDGDGKTDMVVVSSSTLNIYKNTSIGGVLTFAIPTYINLNGSIGVAIDDLNGDGKPDIVVANFSASTISIFKNTSAAGAISFASPIILNTGLNAYDVAIGDFDGDGRPDIAVTNEYSSPAYISVFQNTTAVGGAITFGSEQKFGAESAARGIRIADIDGDTKPDIIVASQGGVVSIYRNTSTANSVNFATRQVYPLAAPSNVGEFLVPVDMDGDGKLDLVVTDNNVPGTISIFKNQSVPGSVILGAASTLAATTNPFGIAAGDINGDGKPDIVVTGQISNDVSVYINNTASQGGAITMANPVIFSNTGTQPRNTIIADMNGDGRPDLLVGANGGPSVAIFLGNDTKVPAVITFPAIAQQVLNQSPAFAPGASSNNNQAPIVYTSSDPSVAYIGTDGLVHLVSTGTVTITANQAGSTDYLAASPVSQTFSVVALQTISFAAIHGKTTCSADFNANATSTNSTIPLGYSSLNTAVATVDGTGNIHITGAGSTTITVTQAGNANYVAATPVKQTFTVAAQVKPVVSVAANSLFACVGSALTITATTNAPAGVNFNYQWAMNGVNTGTNSPTLSVTSVKLTDAFTCSVTDVSLCLPTAVSNSLIGLEILPYSSVSAKITSSATGAVCAGTAITFTAGVTNGGTLPTYQWMVNGVAAGTNSSTFTANTFLNNDQVSCQVTNNASPCLVANTVTSNTVTVAITPTPALLANIAITGGGVRVGDATTFAATVSYKGNITGYQWLVNGVDQHTDANVFTSSKLHNNDVVECIVTGNLTCSVPVTSNVLKLTLLPPLAITIPNLFTPNGDGINDVWDIPTLANYPKCKVSIQNRYGEQVYSSVGYGKAWDGTKQGSNLPIGTYYYVIDLGTTAALLSGSVTIVR